MAIEFGCQCGNVFRLDDDEAGAEIQCTQCGRLNDVPLPSDLKKIAEDGTFRLDEAPVLHNPKKVAEMLYVYSRHEHDTDGYQKDLRLSEVEAEDIGVGAHAPISGERPIPHGPRYDPETGELVREIDVAPPDAKYAVGAQTIPPGMATLAYATVQTPGTLSFGSAFVQLFQPGNLAVMGAMLIMHAITWPLMAALEQGMLFLIIAVPFVLLGIVGHYGNIVDEIGPSDHDELPRPLRDLQFYDDLWAPFCHVSAALMLSYFPVAVISSLATYRAIPTSIVMLLSAIFTGVGSFVFPAIFLTLQTSGTPVNLRPDRVWHVITASGPMYLVLTALWIAAMSLYSWGVFGQSFAIASMMSMVATPRPFRWGLTLPILVAGVVLTHYFCFCLGLLYRAHHADFPWVLQRHVRTTPPAVTLAPQTPRRRGSPPRQ